MEILDSYEVQALIAIILNAYPILIYLCILITLPATFTKGKHYKLMFATVVFGILSSIGECLSYLGDLVWKDRTIGLILGSIDFLFIVLFRFVESYFILNYTDSGLKINKILKIIVYPILVILVLFVTISPLAKQIYYIPEDGYIIEYGPLFKVYSFLQLLVVFSSIITVYVNRKKMGTYATAILISLQTFAIISNYFIGVQTDFALTITSLIILVFYISIYQGEMLKAAQKEKIHTQQLFELADMKTKVVLSQVKPHFIYNALSSIAVLCTKDALKAKELTLDFSDYLRNNIDALGSNEMKICHFEEELEHIKTYLSIEEVRFGNKLNVTYDIKEEKFYLPTLSIQPIVENAVKHGVCKKKGGGNVMIATAKKDDGYLVKVSDDGVGFEYDKTVNDGQVHIGLQNIEKRIKMFGGDIKIESKVGEGTTVTIFFKEKEELR